jgi:hypothetical protein
MCDVKVIIGKKAAIPIAQGIFQGNQGDLKRDTPVIPIATRTMGIATITGTIMAAYVYSALVVFGLSGKVFF